MVLLLLSSCGGCSFPFIGAAKDKAPKSLGILSYNVQNLFDDASNGDEYYEYDPSRGEWSSELFHRKLMALSEVLLHSPRGGADILVLQEVENLNAVRTLRDHYLKGGGYRYICVSDTPGMAIQQACLSRYPIVSSRSHRCRLEQGPELRPVVECTVDVHGLRISLLMNHWKSKSGGAEETEPLRLAAAAVVRRVSAEIGEEDPGRDLLVLGDLNERVDEFLRVGRAYPTALVPLSEHTAEIEDLGAVFLTADRGEIDGATCFYSPWLEGEVNTPGSYVYGGEWERIDHALIGPALFDGEGYDYDAFSVRAPEFALDADGRPLGFRRRFGTGYSDHLPILLELELQ
jgi:endonuclease/exonuclease/phosphatase family metal-dependent hydrolase